MTDVAGRLAGLSREERALLFERLREKRERGARPAPPPLRDTGSPQPLSFSQERLWFLDRLTPGTGTYNLSTPFRLLGPLDPAVLARALHEIARRHETLRTRFEERDGAPVQVVDPPRLRTLPEADLSALPEPRRTEEAARLAAEEAHRPFDLRSGPLWRAALLRLGLPEHNLLLTLHHIVSDGWSVRVLSRELVALYEAFAAGLPSPLPELSVQYPDFARWQRERLAGAELQGQLAYWRGQLGDNPPALDLPFDRPRPAIQTYRGASVSTVLPPGLSASLHRTGLASRASLFMTLLAGFEVLLHRMSGQDDVLVGTPVAGRVRSDVEELIGCFLNTLVLRTAVSGGLPFRELLLRVRETAVEAYAHQEIPFEKLLEALKPERDPSRTPLFQVFFNLVNLPDLGVRLPGGLTVETLARVETESKFDLTVYALEIEEGLRLQLVYNADLFDAPRMEEMLRQYCAVLERVVVDPEIPVGAIPLVTPEAASLLPDPTAPLGEEWQGAVHELFAAHARRHPERPAVSDPEGAWTYGELARAVEGLAARLREAGVEKGDRVAVWAHRSAPVAWAVLSTLRAGAAFVMLDPAYPAARIAEMLRLAGPRAFLQIAAAGEPPDEVEAWLRESGCWRLTLRRGLSLPEAAPAVEIGPDDLAYVAFTSGSTGVPRGILGRHGPLSHFIPWQAERFGLDGDDRYSLLSGLAHDPLQRDLFTPLATGASLAAPAPDDLLVPGRLAAWAAREGITVAHLTPALGRVLTEGEAARVPSLRRAFFVGDVLTHLDVDRLRRIAPNATCVNLYGSTETQRAVAFHVVDGDGLSQGLPLGRGIRDVQLLVLRPAGPPALAGIGELGEICVRSPHLAAGYLDDEAGTRERFPANPFTGHPGDRIYRTGDLGRYRPDGQVTFAGRADQQVKIRGFRVEPGEVEAALGRLPGVREAVALVRQDGPDPLSRRLVAYVVPDPGGPADPGELRQELAARLPAYMVPSSVVFLEKIPVTPNGKVDRRALPAPEAGAGLPGDFAETGSDLEQAVAEVFREVLSVPHVGLHESFFDLGGHSLLGTSLLSRLRGLFGVELPLRALFEEPTVAGFARRIGERLRSKDPRLPAPPPLIPLPRKGDPPLSFAQQRLWFLDRLMPGNPFYNLSGGGRLTGPLDAGTLRRAFCEVARRHETLRTGFAEADGRPVQRIAPETDLEIPVVDLSGLAPELQEAVALRLAAERAREPFDLTRPGLFRLTLLRLEGGERPAHILLWTLHHIISDAWSNSVLAGEVAALYAALRRGEPSPLPELPIQYADFTVWQRKWLSGEVIERQLAYWRERLAGAPGTELPADRPRPPVQSFRGANVLTLVPAETLAGAAALARSRGLSTFMVLLGAFQVLLMRHSGQEDVVVGSPVANRTRPALERLIGFFINTLVLRTDCGGDPSFEALLARVKSVALGAYAHQDLPFEQLVEEMRPRRDLSRNPLFQIALNLVNTPLPRIEVTGDLAMSPLPVPGGTSLFDLQAAMVETPGGLAITWEHATGLFDRVTVERLARHFETLLAGAVAGPGRRLSNLPVLTPAERHQLVAWNDTREDLGAPVCLHDLFFARAQAQPGAPALLWQDGEMTYGELAFRARRLAGRLSARGTGPGHRVAIRMEPSAERAAAVLAVLASGAAYVPLDPSYPRERLEFMLEDSGASLFPLDVEEEGEIGPAPAAAGPDDLAYVIYTSGSTGRPKGVMVRHAAAVNTLRDVNRRFGVGPEDRVLALSSLAFDLSVYDLFGVLAAGGAIVLPPSTPTPDPASWTEPMARHGVTVWNSAPALMELLLSSGGILPPALRLVLLSGDWIPVSMPDQIRRQVPDARVVSLGGATEGSIWSILYPVGAVDPAWTSIPYGRPMANQAVHVLDGALRPVPVGVVGEMWIGGDGVADGYFARPDLTAERFVPDPFDGRPGVRLYRTGDLGRRFADGVIEFLGRRDHQVKVRGFRIELGEIESVLASHPAVREAVAVVRREEGAPRGSGRLVAYVVPENGEIPGDLRTWLAGRLPEPMVPSSVVRLDRLPLSANGKVDRRALPAPEADSGRSGMPPATDTERMLAGIWAELLKVDRVGREDHFFELGGHSLLAAQVAARVREIFGIELPLAVLFQETALESLSRTVDARLASEGVGERAPEIRPVPRDGDLPLSFAQQRLWFLDRLMPGTPFYSLAGGVRLDGPLDAGALLGAVQEVVRRHETLRTGFAEVGGRPVQRIVPDLKAEVPVLDLADLPPEEREAAVRRIAGERLRTPFDLTRPGLLRVILLRLRGGERPGHILLWAIHHIVSDAWSNAVLMDEVAALYAGQALPELPVQYADFAVWQREWLSGERLFSQLAYWRERLAGVPVLELPADRPRPPVQTFRGATYRTLYGRPLLDSLSALARRRDASLFMTLLAAFDILLCRFTGQEDVAVGTPIANRAQPVLERLIGFFINTLVLRTDCAGDPSFLDLLARVKEAALGAYAHQDLPFEQLVEDLQPRRDLSRNPLFQVMLNLLNAPPPRAEVTSELEMSPLPPADGTALFDLQAYALEEPAGLRIAWEHNTDLFDRGTVERLSRSFETLLAAIVERPEAPLHDLPLLTPEERAEILVRWNDTAAPVPEPGTVHALFEAQAARTPEAAALVFEGETLTYAELNARANRVAHHLRSLGVGPEVLVGLRFERSVPAVLAVLAVLKAGGAYVPLDPGLPAERLAFLLEDSQAALVLTEVEEKGDSSNLTPLAGPGNLAYVLYTSGSTGRPKGVEVTHRGVVNFLASVARRPGLTPDDAVLAVTTLSFDIAAYELLLPLTVGARIVLVTRETALDGERLAAVLSAQGVTRVQVTPATWRLLLGSGWAGDPRLMALSGGEALPRDLARELLPRAGSLWNFYGPTETTIWSSVHRVEEAEGAIPIGLPVGNTAIHLLDRRLEPVPLGVAGELYIGGAGVSRGYLRRPGLTAERFVPDPFSPGGGRLYRTGDLGRRRATGEIEFLGRADHQVKIRGFRVEPGEIEAVLAEDSAVRQAAVVLREVDGDPRLVAWLVWEEGREGDPRALRERLRKRVPEYMIPSAFIPLPALPLTPSGKVDRRALAAREEAADRPLSFVPLSVPPRTPAEQQMAGLFAEVLGRRGEPVGAHDNFFELGGHSLLATRLVSRVRVAFGVDLPLRALFEAQTVAGLTATVLAREKGAEEPGIRRLHATEAPLSFSQERLWFLERLLPGTATYSLPSFVRLRGPLDPAPLARAFTEIVRRHEALRTRFLERSGVPVQVIDPPGPNPLPLVDLSALPEPELRAESGRLAREEAARPFDLERGPVLRTTLLRLGSEEHGLLVDVHHIATDGWSQNLLVRELAVLYEAFSAGARSPLPELPVQYPDYAVWQRERLAGEGLERQLAYWRERLGGNPPSLDLPLDRPRPAVQTFRGEAVFGALPRDLSESLARLANAEGASLFMVLLAGFKLLLRRQSGQDDVLAGTPIAGRLRPEVEDLIGFFLNTLVLRTDLSGRPTFRELLRRVRETALSAYAHQDVPFEKLLEELQPERDLSRTPLFQVFFNMLNLPSAGLRLPGGLALEPLGGAESDSKFDLTVYVAEREEGIALHLVYNADLFDAARVEELVRQYRSLLAQAVEQPGAPVDRISLLTPEAVPLLPDPRAPLGDAWHGAVHERFAEHARRHPERPALSDPDGSWTYGELARAVEGLAARLREAGVEKGDRVAVWAHRSAPVAWAVLGTLRAGAAFVMLDPAYPAARIVEMLRLAGPRAFLQIAAAGDPPDEVEAWLRETGCWRLTLRRGLSLPGTAPAVEIGPDDLAYVAFTSGSTGVPKGILGRHGPLSHFIPWQAERFGLTGEDRYSLLSGLAHDPLQRDLFTPLATGASLAAPAPDDLLVPGRLAAWAAREGITVAHLTPALGRVMTEGGSALIPSLRWVLLVGDVLTRLDVDRLRRIAPNVTCVNLYGSTETQRAVAFHVVEEDSLSQVLPLGRGMPDVQLLVVRPGEEPALAGIGEVGEICVRSPHLAAGYLGDEAGTRARFLTNPFTRRPGDRIYRTGDLGRYRPDGQATFAGRADQQVKIRGFRIELGEIEAALGRLPGVKEAVVLALPEGEDRRLVAFAVGEAGEDLRQALAAKLPAYMVPSAFVRLERMPVTPNGKVDRRALAALKPEARGSRESLVPPRTPAERRMAGIWAEVLGLPEDRVGVHESFFELGGHSLLATRLASRVQAAFGAGLPLRALFETPTVAALTAVVLAGAGQGEQRMEPIARRSATEAPLSFSQERLWFLERLTPGTGMYNLPGAARLRGPLDLVALEHACGEIVRRHETLRTRFEVRAGLPVQVIAPPAPWSLPVVDLSGLPESRGESERLAAEEAARSFDLQSGRLLRTALLRLGREEHALLVTVHHIASDGWSQRLLFRELAAGYAGAPRAELPVQYADYAVWQRERLAGETLERQLAFWRERLGDRPAPLDLPLDRPRPAIQTFRGAAVAAALPRGLSERLQALSVAESASLFMVLLAGFELLLHRQSGQDDVVVGTPVAGRLRPEVEDLIGFFLNTLVLRTDLSGKPTFRELVRRVRETALSAYAHQDVPFERLLQELQPERDLSRTPLFQVFFNMLNLPPAEARLPSGLAIEPLGTGAGDAKFDLTVYAAQGEEGIGFNLVYNADLFDHARIEELLRQYEALLAQAVERPDAPAGGISLVTPEAAALLPDPRAALGDAWRGAVHTLFTERARRHPERPAVTDPEGTTAYGELAYAVRRLAAHLRASGVEKGDRVAIWAHRSAPVAWAVLATLEAGGAFVMLDPAYPASRIVEMLELASPRAFLAVAAAGDPPAEVEAWLASAGLACRVTLPGGGPRGARDLVAGLPQPLPPVEVGPDDLAYVAFTSGSTGIPKGILGRHGPLSHFLPWQAERFGLGPGDRYSLLSGLAHDPLQRDLFTPLCLGGSLVAPSFEEIATPGRLAAWMAREGVTVAHLTPALGQLLTEPPGRGAEPATIPSLRWVLLVGDVLTRLDVDRIRRIAPHATCVNLYGSTETQRAVAFHVVVEESGRMRQVLPLGRGMEDVQLLVVRPGDEPALAGVGEVGEIWVRSPHLAAGYLGDPELSGDRFRLNPWTHAPGDRVYRTGDLGRYLPDGEVAFAGRADQQVKIRGFRIEPGEIEAALGRLPGVREAVVIARQDGSNGPESADRRLVAYVVPDPAGPPAVEGLREALRARLPAYMVPSAFVLLEQLPLTPNRKVDRRALPAPEAPGAGEGFVEPGSDLERTIAEVWREVLGLDRVGVRSNFFDLGGHSLLLVRLHARLQEALGRDLALVDLFNYPNIRSLAEHLGRQDGGSAALTEARSRGQRQQEAARRQRELAMARRGPRRRSDE